MPVWLIFQDRLPALRPEVCCGAPMSGLHEVDCNGCGRRYETSAEQARKQRVLRCPCGQFVRLDRALKETRSESAASSGVELARAVGDQVEEQPHQRVSSSARGTLSSLSQAQWKPPSSSATDKPLWYVDLGGSETVEMTIEQLIIARRSGKLGEGALVWREGMPRWRPVGTLIPATSVTSRPTPTPPAPSRPPAARTPSQPTLPPSVQRARLPSQPPDGAQQSLGSYERPVATLEFALEGAVEPRPAAPTRSALSSVARAPSPTPLRAPTPVPRQATWSAAPAAPPPPPVPSPSPLPAAPSAEIAVHSPAESFARNLLGDRPRWVSACIALSVCITASGSGAFLVRSLKQRKQPLALTASPVVQATASVRSPSNEAEPTPKAATSRPLVIDLESLSVERSARRLPARPNPVLAPKMPITPAVEPSIDGSEGTPADSPAPAQAPVQKPKSIELPAAARANPYTTGSIADSAPKKLPTDRDAPGL